MKLPDKEKLEEFFRQYWSGADNSPKYERLANSIKFAIADGFWKEGDSLPSEFAWTSVAPCGLATVQRAFRNLANAGVIRRVKGSGTIVGVGPGSFDEPWHMRFLCDADSQSEYLEVNSSVVFRTFDFNAGEWSEYLKEGTGGVVAIGRVFDIGGKFKVLNTFYAKVDKVGSILGEQGSSLENVNIKKLIAQRLGTQVSSIRHRMVFRDLPAWAFEFDVGGDLYGCVTLNAVAYDGEGNALYYQDFYIPRNPYVLELGGGAF